MIDPITLERLARKPKRLDTVCADCTMRTPTHFEGLGASVCNACCECGERRSQPAWTTPTPHTRPCTCQALSCQRDGEPCADCEDEARARAEVLADIAYRKYPPAFCSLCRGALFDEVFNEDRGWACGPCAQLAGWEVPEPPLYG